ncbi:hypothetical protein GKZ89_09680 [Bacillus mangrovi]|uniref:Excalibur calcium-binding domain-containing protein n=1 Tax=Metabacillus mangrovi TaxID=1491830 RepID=A0A7X2S4Q6_9BACI|nr:excalibur calcium-binding domain-containing protein [Metabacillus mangrovi]MTH53673.1 hypothetical protein [Metabacillus mangrovi]
MNLWIGNNPTHSQKYVTTKFKKTLNHIEHTVLVDGEFVLKIIEAELDKKYNNDSNGVLIITNHKLIFASSRDKQIFHFNCMRDLGLVADGKDKNEWVIRFYSNGYFYKFDDIKKNDDTDEFFFTLKEKIHNPSQEILTTVTHNFDYFLHAQKLDHLKLNGIKITPFLMKRDDKGVSSNGARLLKEKHTQSQIVTEGFFVQEKKKGNFIVVDEKVYLYEYNQEKRKATPIKVWPIIFFNHVNIDYFALKTELHTNEGKLVLNNSGKEFAAILIERGIQVSILKRKWYKKILGFRSGKWWKSSIASLVYFLIFFIGISTIFGESPTEEKAANSSSQINSSENSTAQESKMETTAASAKTEENQQEEAIRLAEEQKKKEATARLAEEQKKIAEEARIAEEQKKTAEEARIAEEQRKEEEAARLAEEERKAEEEAVVQNVFYKNCSAVRAAGAAPIREGDPGYSTKLDRDRDGIACDQ